MLNMYDDYLVHQTSKPLSEVASADPNWQEALYFNIQDGTGTFSAICGLDVFPNAHYAAAWLVALHDGQHYAYLYAGPLGNWREELAAGTLAFSIVEPMRRWRLRLADEANGIHAALEFEARYPAYHFRPIRCEQAGEVVFDQSYYNQGGTYRGTMTVGDKTFTGLSGVRARRWGSLIMPRIPFYNWVSIPLPSRCIAAWQFESPAGEVLYCDGAVTSAGGEITPITRMDHEWTLAPGTRHPMRVGLVLSLVSGETLRVDCRERGTHFVGALPARWSDADAAARVFAESNAYSIEACSEFTVGAERAIGIYDVVSRSGYDRYGLAPLAT
ncbi:MAG: hypothetical protein U0587_15090 [Candidatus Binatia bacterium]